MSKYRREEKGMSYSNEKVLERFAPQFDEAHTARFQALLNRIEQAFPYNPQQMRKRLHINRRCISFLDSFGTAVLVSK